MLNKQTMIFILSLMAIVINGNAYSKLTMEKAWNEEITFDFMNLDFKANFDDWKQTFNKKYPNTLVKSENDAFETFMKNWKMINDFNQQEHSYKLKMNQFSDFTTKQFKTYIHGSDNVTCVQKKSVQERIKMQKFINSNSNSNGVSTSYPTELDWTSYQNKSYVTAVKDQGQCGSCWAFSAVGAIESRTAVRIDLWMPNIQSLSVQQLLDCSAAQGNHGCQGGSMDNAFKYAMAAGGMCINKDYPYTGVVGKCNITQCDYTNYYPIVNYAIITTQSVDGLIDGLQNGPVSVAIEADQTAVQFYSSGVLDGECGSNIDQGVLLVGYGSQDGQNFWKIKNSWGTSWGMQGYALICKECNKNNGQGQCGILDVPSFPYPKVQMSRTSPNFINEVIRKFKAIS